MSRTNKKATQRNLALTKIFTDLWKLTTIREAQGEGLWLPVAPVASGSGLTRPRNGHHSTGQSCCVVHTLNTKLLHNRWQNSANTEDAWETGGGTSTAIRTPSPITLTFWQVPARSSTTGKPLRRMAAQGLGWGEERKSAKGQRWFQTSTAEKRTLVNPKHRRHHSTATV